MRKVARRVGLLDKPSGRKKHKGSIPLVGGISLFIGVTCYLVLTSFSTPGSILYFGCALVLLIVGVLDDRFDLSVKSRMLIQLIVTVVMMVVGNLWLKSFGNLLGFGELNLRIGGIGYLVTVLGVIGAINAFNMVDGIDGLLGGLASVTLAGLGYWFYMAGLHQLAAFCFAFIAATIPYILLNLGIPWGRKFKVFMGDAGSMVIGFSVIWLLMQATQGTHTTMRPVTALWLVAIPLMDMVAIMARRIKKGQSPFKPDRNHLHHILLRAGFTSGQTLLVICVMSALLACIGLTGEMQDIPAPVMLLSFLVLFVLYNLAIRHIWRVTKLIRRFNRPSVKAGNKPGSLL
ncbi:UDP-N-acetylglucosamine--undecaprenyl-phosphate N-acetylglucosaminephosphotransferase [Dongshaea marina]|uniref:UDP-N-acetylglucosamine--undecaprenyl-phosphate N-acetylglucosaminephosphotransferase n=1 Tax=Dongshaea marina TaxID=2047966 RepID=UPI001F2FA557|nr:UDP-N-acetylglucosamine--undecaprenyl-phosphate N-acetylglucosaminephosphotransferase [Dongshaea marina]